MSLISQVRIKGDIDIDRCRYKDLYSIYRCQLSIACLYPIFLYYLYVHIDLSISIFISFSLTFPLDTESTADRKESLRLLQE